MSSHWVRSVTRLKLVIRVYPLSLVLVGLTRDDMLVDSATEINLQTHD